MSTLTMKGTILVTGGTTGIGYYTAVELAKTHKDLTLIVASRSDTNSSAAAIAREANHPDVQYMSLDLGELAKVRDFAARITAKHPAPISILVLNAGLQYLGTDIKYSPDHIERTLAVNHVGHALLFHLLTPLLSDDARIVVTASGVHDPAEKWPMPEPAYTSAEKAARPSPDDIKELKIGGQTLYVNSKLANVMWTYALGRRLANMSETGSTKKWTVVAFDPGLMPGTQLTREMPLLLRILNQYIMPLLIPLVRLVMNPYILMPTDSAKNLAWLAAEDRSNAKYFMWKKDSKSSVQSYREDLQEDLWEWTIKEIAKDEEEARRFDKLTV